MTRRQTPVDASRRRGKPTIIDVATLAAVHPSTVSRALNPDAQSKVSPATVSRVLEAARQLGYQPNPLARGLKVGSTSTVGMLIPDLTNPLFPPIVRGIEDRLREAGWTLLITNTDNDEEKEGELLGNMLAQRVDGLILATARRDYPLLDEVLETGLPLVLVNRTSERPSASSVTPDDYAGIGAAVGHLVRLGHREIAYVGGPRTLSTGLNRYQAFVSSLHNENLELDDRRICFAEEFQEERSVAAFEQLLDRGAKFTAVVCGNDLIALGGYDVLTARGLSIPTDVSIVGYNGIPFCDKFSPPLTSVQVPQYHIGVTAADLFLELTANRDRPPRSVSLRPELVVRKSTAPPHP
ncbi:MAG: LacI family DNA-binding transcriptional regulator [Streptosporangiales bacterium]|nr:LacI family DNA-binding transcriptional regulator [Streptosporangiales bacterium]